MREYFIAFDSAAISPRTFLKLKPLLGYEICLECEETGANNMVAIAERIAVDNSATKTRFLSLETLAKRHKHIAN